MAVKTYPRYERDEASLHNDGQSWEIFDAEGFRVDALEDGEQFHVRCCTSRLARGNSQGRTHSETSSNYLCTNDG